jgi:hypothetical protein
MVRAVVWKYAIAIGALAFAGVIAVILLSSHPADDTTAQTVNIEIRARTRAEIHAMGRLLGPAPKMLVVPMSHAPFAVQADLGHGRVVSKTVVPDHDQVVQIN